jgi:4-amino-4-deoxy-L-arabinose transferase-like glycosyltransferase
MKTKLILILIFVISFFLRIYKINETPPLLWDEAALGYNAYSILETGKDEYGKQFPLIFKSFGDYKPGFYVYLSLPFVKIFGLNEISVRLPSIILGSLIPILLYFLIINLDKNKHKLALIAAWISCFNPYNIHYSRGAWETNIITFQIILLFLLFFKRKYILSGIVLGLSLYTYQSGKMLGLLSILILWIIAKNNIFKAKFIIPIFLLAIPIAYGLFFLKTPIG